MAKGFISADYNVTKTGVLFSTTEKKLQHIYDRCEMLCLENIKQFGDKRVLQEGAKYQGVWLETQPMGGEMYAKRDMEVALNNHLIFMQYQRRDGRMPGMITFTPPFGVAVHQDWMQGDFFTRSAFRMYYLIGKNTEYLKLLYTTLKDFDDYLWTYRDSDGDGCLETWCLWDTGDDNSTRYMINDVHALYNGAWDGEQAPYGVGKLPYESAEYMAYSYSHRAVLAQISDILENGEGDLWREKALAVQRKMRSYLWNDERKAIFDRDCDNIMMDALTMENLKCMYHGAFTQDMADDFIRCHLLNPAEFWTATPLPSIAVNDPLFYVDENLNNCANVMNIIRRNMTGDILDNSWSGPSQGLTFQRAVDALLNYGHHAEVTLIGRRLLAALGHSDKYVQQYNPMTSEPTGAGEGYGPTLLATLEYIAYMYGVAFACDKLTWSSAVDGEDSEYTQHLFGCDYTLTRENGRAEAKKDGAELFTVTDGVRVVTDLSGRIEEVFGMNVKPVAVQLKAGSKMFGAVVRPNEEYHIVNGALVRFRQIAFDYPSPADEDNLFPQ